MHAIVTSKSIILLFVDDVPKLASSVIAMSQGSGTCHRVIRGFPQAKKCLCTPRSPEDVAVDPFMLKHTLIADLSCEQPPNAPGI